MSRVRVGRIALRLLEVAVAMGIAALYLVVLSRGLIVNGRIL